MEVNTSSNFKTSYGVHQWTDKYGNKGAELLSQHHIISKFVRVHGLLQTGEKRPDNGLVTYFNHDGLLRRIFVVLDASLPEAKIAQVLDYFSWCKTQGLLNDYTVTLLAILECDRTFEMVETVVAAAQRFGLRRRDLFVAFGGTTVTTVAGFAAAIYRRSTPWILVPTDPLGIIRWLSSGTKRLRLHSISHDGSVHKEALALVHPPVETFYDPESLSDYDVKHILIEIIRISLLKSAELFFYIEAHIDIILETPRAQAILDTALHRAAKVDAAIEGVDASGSHNQQSLLVATVWDEVIRKTLETKNIAREGDANQSSLAISLMSALSVSLGILNSKQLYRVLNLIKKVGFKTYDKAIEETDIWEHLIASAQEWEATGLIVPATLGKWVPIGTGNVSPGAVRASLHLLRQHQPHHRDDVAFPGREEKITVAADDPIHVKDGLYEQNIREDVRYHVATVPNIFDRENMTLIKSYCAPHEGSRLTARKKKILLIVDDYLHSTTASVFQYFEHHRVSIDSLRALPMHVSSADKDMDPVRKVLDAATDLGMSQGDLMIAVGGGTIMDVVGFAAAMYNGGIPYLRIPTTLVGMIDAGIGAKTGVNFGSYKSLIGRYFAPVACLNDPETFLATLSQREFACGLAEALKMAILKSPRLFEVIERYHGQATYSIHTEELIQLSIRTMLEELQPNLHEESLRRLVDFGHEFGHIVEGLARYDVPHGECVAVGMAISSFLGYLSGILSQTELDRILNCILHLRLPIHLEDHQCCDPDTLWSKISTGGIDHKDGMLLLVVPQAVGQGTFIEEISEINASMLRETMMSLKLYANEYARLGSVTLGNVSASASGSPDLSSSVNTSSLTGVDINSSPWTLSDKSGSGSCSTESDITHTDNKHLLDVCRSANGNEEGSVMVAAVIGASGDIGSQLVSYLVQSGVRVICSVRPASLLKFKRRVGPSTFSAVRVLVGEVIDLTSLREMIQEADVLYNMAGAVTLSSKPAEFPKVVALNGFVQGVLTDLIRGMGRDQDLKVVYPSTQRVHLIKDSETVNAWIRDAADAYSTNRDAFANSEDISLALDGFSGRFLAAHPLPAGFNVYEISKRLGECFVSWLPRHSLVRISSAYGPSFTRGFMYRAIHPKARQGNVESAEKRDFIYADDLNELLFKAAQMRASGSNVFDAASGDGSIQLQEVWNMVRDLTGDGATATFESSGVVQDEMNPDSTFARQILGREFTPLRDGLRKTIEESAQMPQENIKQAKTQHWNDTRAVVVDVGSTYMRVGLFMSPHGLRLDEVKRVASPSRQTYPEDSLAELQERLLDAIAQEINAVRTTHEGLPIEDVGISLGAVVTRDGVIEDASILWNEPARGYDLKRSLQERLPTLRLTILNDISAAAWRYKDEERFCLITVSSGLSNKVFNANLHGSDRLDLDSTGLGGEMGHVVVEPRAVSALVQHVMLHAMAQPEEFTNSRLSAHVGGEVQKINPSSLALSAKQGDGFTLRLLEEADVPYCPCGNLADLCSYSSGRAALRRAMALAARGDYGVDLASETISDDWLRQSISAGHPLALKVLQEATYPLALRILQLASDIGLEKFIIVGGFPQRTSEGVYLETLRDHLVSLCHRSGFFSGWTDGQVRRLVRLGEADDNDGLIGMGHFIQNQREHYRAVEKPVGEVSLKVTSREIPRCGAREIVSKVVYAGICTTDLQILRGERGLEPVVLGHEGVCQVLEVGKDVKGLSVGEMIVLNPNNPLDDHDKLGHTREGVFQEYIKFGQEFLDREQVLRLGSGAVSATDTLIEPLSCVVAAQERIRDRIAGKNVLVVGAGFMGLLFALMNAKMGARNVYLANRSRGRLDFAIARGIAQENKVLVINENSISASSQVNEVTAGKGVDVVIICVSLGQGVRATQNAMKYVNPGGCIYLFAGFRPGDALTLDEEGGKLDAWSIRSGWKTERVCVAGKSLDISGHRGSRREDLASAAHHIRSDRMTFGGVISHVISLGAIPESVLSLAKDGSIRGVPAQRVVVDMEARGEVVQRAEELPLRHLYESAGKQKESIPQGNLFRKIGFAPDSSMLGWVLPPKWREIQTALVSALHNSPLSNSPRHVIWVGTGGWTSLVEALREIMPTDPSMTFHTLQSLDPQTLKDVLQEIGDISSAVCLGMSQSGTTLETVILMNTLRERFDNAGLDYVEHFAWLTDMSGSVTGSKGSGEEVIRSSKTHDWGNVSMLPLTVTNSADSNALFCAPHSMVMFLALFLLLQNDLGTMERMYQQYLRCKIAVVDGIVSKAYTLSLRNVEHIQVNLDESIASSHGLVKLPVQLIEQALGSKKAGFNPHARVGSGSENAAHGFEVVNLEMPHEHAPVVKAMLSMDALSVFVAMLAYQREIEFVTHPKVSLYKCRAADLIHEVEVEIEQEISDFDSISAAVVEYIGSNPQTLFVEILYYGQVSELRRRKVVDWMLSRLRPISQNISIDLHQGEEWNHSRYQAAVQREDSLHVVLVPRDYCHRVEGIAEGTVRENAKMLQAIARATFETLHPASLYFRVEAGEWKEMGLE